MVVAAGCGWSPTSTPCPVRVEAAQREAKSAFGDPTVFCERYLPTGHHVEVQVMADTHGTVWAVGERECSIPATASEDHRGSASPWWSVPGMRDKLFEAARLATAAIGYVGAGTVEFWRPARASSTSWR